MWSRVRGSERERDVTATDALFIFRFGVGQPVVLDCPNCA